MADRKSTRLNSSHLASTTLFRSDRATEAGTELVLVVGGPYSGERVTGLRNVKKVLGVGDGVAEELERRSVKSIGPRLGDHVNHRAGHTADVGREEAGLHFDLLYSVNGRLDADCPDNPFVVVDAIDHVVVGHVALAVRGNGGRHAAIIRLDAT